MKKSVGITIFTTIILLLSAISAPIMGLESDTYDGLPLGVGIPGQPDPYARDFWSDFHIYFDYEIQAGSSTNLRGVAKADGKSAYVITAIVYLHREKAPNQEVTFFIEPNEGVVLSAEKAITDEHGRATTILTSTQPGGFEINAYVGNYFDETTKMSTPFSKIQPVIRFTADDPNYYIDDQSYPAQGIIFEKNYNIYICLRDFSNAIGAKLAWNQETQTATMIKDNIKLVTTANTNAIALRIEEREWLRRLYGPALIHGGRITYLITTCCFFLATKELILKKLNHLFVNSSDKRDVNERSE